MIKGIIIGVICAVIGGLIVEIITNEFEFTITAKNNNSKQVNVNTESDLESLPRTSESPITSKPAVTTEAPIPSMPLITSKPSTPLPFVQIEGYKVETHLVQELNTLLEKRLFAKDPDISKNHKTLKVTILKSYDSIQKQNNIVQHGSVQYHSKIKYELYDHKQKKIAYLNFFNGKSDINFLDYYSEAEKQRMAYESIEETVDKLFSDKNFIIQLQQLS